MASSYKIEYPFNKLYILFCNGAELLNGAKSKTLTTKDNVYHLSKDGFPIEQFLLKYGIFKREKYEQDNTVSKDKIR